LLAARRRSKPASGDGFIMTKRKVVSSRRVTRGTNNVFADIGFPDADVRQVKLRLAYCVTEFVGQPEALRCRFCEGLGSVPGQRAGDTHRLHMAGLVAGRLLDFGRDWTCNGRLELRVTWFISDKREHKVGICRFSTSSDMEQGQLNWGQLHLGHRRRCPARLIRSRKVPRRHLPLRRLDAVLEPTKQAVLDMKASLDKAGINEPGSSSPAGRRHSAL